MADKLCCCPARSPTLSGAGSRSEPFELEYEGSNDSYTTPPIAPVEMAVSPVAIDEESAPTPCCAHPIALMIPAGPTILTPVSDGEDTPDEIDATFLPSARPGQCVRPGSGRKLTKQHIVKPTHPISTAVQPCQFHPYHIHSESNLH